MQAKLIILAILVSIMALGSNADAEDYPYLWYPHVQNSVASVSGAEGTFFNPAALKADPRLELGFYHSLNDSTFNGDNGIVFSRGGFGISYYNLHLDGKPGVNSWTLAAATKYTSRLLLGLSYTFYKTDREGYHNDHFWKTGFLYRPSRQFSFGAVIDNVNRMEFASKSTERVYTIGAGFRPFKEKVTISADYRIQGGEELSDGLLTGFLEVELKEGLWLNGHVDENREFGIGLSFAFGESITDCYGRFDRDGGFSKGVISHKYTYNRPAYALLEPDRYVILRLSGSYPEERRKSLPFVQSSCSFADLILGLDKISKDRQVTGVAVHIEDLALGWAQLEELRGKLSCVRRNGKTVVVFLGPFSGTGAYYLASVADRIAMQRVDALSIVGLLAEVTFYKGLLDKLGIEAEIERTGAYKSAADLITREDMSPHHAEAVNALLDDLWFEITVKIAECRGIPTDSIERTVDRSPLTSIEAVDAGLIDTLIYPDMFSEWAESQMPGGDDIVFEDYIKSEDINRRWGEPPRVVVIPAEGSIVRGKSSTSLLLGKTIGSFTLNNSIKKARDSESVKAVVLRVNSPGGEVIGSESIWRQLKLTQEKKPVIVSMSNVAASGGYHISSASDWILAENMTITGSIGVIYGKLNLSGLREKIGFSTYHLKRGENADFYTPARGYTDEQRQKVRSEIELLYRDFVMTVAQNRNTSFERIEEVAQGRSWSGSRAVEHNLIDQIGGLSDAIDVACRMANVNRGDVVVEVVPTRAFSLFPSAYPLESVFELAKSLVDWDQSAVLSELTAGLGECWFYRSPYELHIR